MKLTLYSKNHTKIINLNKEFFKDSEEFVRGKRQLLTPSQKATQLGEDYFGKQYTGHNLEKDGTQISVENREEKRMVTRTQSSAERKFRFS